MFGGFYEYGRNKMKEGHRQIFFRLFAFTLSMLGGVALADTFTKMDIILFGIVSLSSALIWLFTKRENRD